MIARVILTITYQFYIAIVMINPNTGNEMGKQRGDWINNKGNGISGTKMKIRHTILMFVLQLLSIIYKLDTPVNFFDWVVFILATGGVGISYWSYYTLGNLYTFTLGIRPDHKLITEGPYQYLVHPGHLGQFLIIGGAVLFYRVSWIFTLGLAGYIGYQFLKRSETEEQMLNQQFGYEYIEYLNERWRLIPYVY